MSAKENITTLIRTAKEEGKLTIGYKETMRELKKGNIKTVILANNCPEELMKDVEYYSSFYDDVEVIRTSKSNEELGIIARVSYYISVMGIKR